MPTVLVSPFGPRPQFLLATGLPAVGNQLFFYVAGSVGTKQNTYTDSTGGSANPNPIVLNALGEPTNEIWFTAGQQYKVVYAPSTDPDPPTSPIWTVDHLSGVNDVTVGIDQWVASGLTPTFVSATSFTLVGDQTVTLHGGRRLKTTNSGGTIYSTILSSTFGAVTTIVVQNDSGVLDAGLSAVSYGLISAGSTSTPSVSSVYVCEARLTVTSGTAVTTADVTNAETIYFTPFRGDKLDLYNSAIGAWVRVTFAETSMDVPDATQMNDVFMYLSAGVLTADVVAWTNDTTRATALTTQNGVLVKSGAVERRYVGSFYSTTAGNGQVQDAVAARYLWNYYNRVARPMRAVDTADNWAYSLNAYRQANANTANQLNFIVGVSEDEVRGSVQHKASNGTGGSVLGTGVGLDRTNGNDAQIFTTLASTGAGAQIMLHATYNGFPGVGKHFLAWLEIDVSAVITTTWVGDGGGGSGGQTGIQGTIWA